MLQLDFPGYETWDPVKEEFIYTQGAKNVQLEHSLLSISKWESKYHKPFLETKMSIEELIYYISKCMCITKGVNEDIFLHTPKSLLDEINAYINDPMTATPKLPSDKGPSNEIITSELIYYWMSQGNINWDAERWHLNRLLKLIELTSYKNTPPEKRSKADMFKDRREENARRRALWNTKG